MTVPYFAYANVYVYRVQGNVFEGTCNLVSVTRESGLNRCLSEVSVIGTTYLGSLDMYDHIIRTDSTECCLSVYDQFSI
jgi:hypothetical protein